MREAFAIARSGRPGPVFIDILQNVSAQEADYTPVTQSQHFTTGRLGALMERFAHNFEAPTPDEDDIDKLVEMIRYSEKPLREQMLWKNDADLDNASN